MRQIVRKMKLRASAADYYPLVWKTRNSSRNVAVKRISDFQKRWGNSGPFDWFAAD